MCNCKKHFFRHFFHRLIGSLLILILGLVNANSYAAPLLYSNTTPGTWTYTIPANVYLITAYVTGGAGGGGGGDDASGASGGAGGTMYANIYNVTPGTVLSGTIGDGGAGGLYASCTSTPIAPLGGTGVSAGGSGGQVGCVGYSGQGGGGGGDSMLMAGTTVLRAGGGGGGGGGSSGHAPTGNGAGGGINVYGSTGCSTASGPGGSGYAPNSSSDGGGGGGGASGYTGGGGGGAGLDSSTSSSSGGGGSNCYNSGAAYPLFPTTSTAGSTGGGGAAGPVYGNGTKGNSGSITLYTISNVLTLSVVMNGTRGNNADQFVMAIKNGSTVVNVNSTTASTSSGTGSTVTNGTSGITPLVSATTYTLTESMASGSASLLPWYTSSITCTNNTAGSTTTLPSGSGQSFSVVPTGGDEIYCTITNTTIQPTVTVTKSLNASRTNNADQFVLAIKNGSTVVNATTSSTTSGTGSTVTNGTTGATTLSIGTPYTISESMASGSLSTLNDYTGSITCSNSTAGSSTILPSGNGQSFSITPNTADVISCTQKNTPITATLTLANTWSANSKIGNSLSITTTGGNSNPTVSSTVASSSQSTSTSSAATVNAGNTITFPAATFTSGNASNYTTVISCTGNTNALSGNTPGSTLTISPLDTAIVCTYTNTRLSANLNLAKVWGVNSTAGNTISVTTTGGTNNAATGTSVATAAGNTTTGSAVTVYAGDTITVPTETFSVGSASNYTTATTCSGNANTLTAGAFVVSPADTAITCTYTNTPKTATLTLKKIWAVNSNTGNTISIATTGGANQASITNSVATVAGNTSTGTSVTVASGNAITLPAETFSVGSASNYTTTIACSGNTTALSGNVLTVNPADTAITCTYTNTPKTATLTLKKTWGVNANSGDTVSIATTGGANQASITNSIATTVGNTSTGTPVTVASGNVITLPAETFSVGSATSYTTAIACTGNTTALSGNVLTVNPTDTAISCTYTNTPHTATLQLKEVWAAKSKAGDVATASTTGGTNNPTSGSSTATLAGNTTTGTALTVSAGNTITFPAPSFTTGSSSNYTTAISCTGNTNALSGSTIGSTLVISPSDSAPICTYTYTRISANLTLAKVWGINSNAGNTISVTTTGGTNNATTGTSIATVAGNTTTGSAVTVYAGDTITLPTETFSVGSASNYTTTIACSGNTTALSGNVLTVNPADTAITCTYTNTPKTATLTLKKTWGVNANSGDTVSIATTGGANQASITNSIATTVGNTSTGTPVTVASGNVITLPAETFSVGSATSYTTAIACTGNTTALSGNVLTVNPTDTAISCTYTNTPHTATLQLKEVWAAKSKAGDVATASTTGGTNNPTSGSSTATLAGNTTTGTALTVSAGNTITFPAPSFTTGSSSNYTTAISCTGNTNALSGSTIGSTLVISPSDSAPICTYTYTRISANLTLAKVWGINSNAGNTISVTTTGGTNNATTGTSIATVAGNTTTGSAVTVYAGDTITLPTETFSVGSASNYTSTTACSGNTNALSAGSFIVSPTDTVITCTYTNIPKTATLTLKKTWAVNANSGDTVSIVTTGGANQASITNSIATIAGNTSTGTPVTVASGNVITLPAETVSIGSATSYTTAIACTGNTTALSGNVLTVNPADTAISCTYTNTPHTATLQLKEVWAAKSKAGDVATASTTGGTNNPSSGSSTATLTGNTTTGAALTITAGNTITFPAPNFTTGSSANYTTIISCTGNTNALSGSAIGSTLVISPSDTALSCTYTYTRISASLKLVKIWAVNSIAGNTIFVTTTGGTNNATTGTSIATAAGNTTTGSAVTVYAGDNITLPAETFSIGSASNYTTTTTCSGNANALSAGAFLVSPSDTAITCTYTNSLTLPKVTLTVALANARNNSADQFVVAIKNGSIVQNNTTTSTSAGSGSTVTNGMTGSTTLTPGSSYTLLESMASGSVTDMGNYISSINCTNSTSGSSTSLPSGYGQSFTLTPTFDDVINCTLTNYYQATTLTLIKSVDGTPARISASDQFTIGVSSNTSAGNTSLPSTSSVTTSGTSTTNAATIASFSLVVDGLTTYTLSDAMASGSSSLLALYKSVLDCSVTNNVTSVGSVGNTGATLSGATSLPTTLLVIPQTGSGASLQALYTILPAAGDTIVCAYHNITNSARVTLHNISIGNIGTFSFSGASPNDNGFGSDTITTTSTNTPFAGTTKLLAAPTTLTQIQETLPSGWSITSAICQDNNAATTGNPSGTSIGSISGTILTIPAANTLAGADIQCTFTTTYGGFTISGKVVIDNGLGGGTAHDGIQNGSEIGHAGETVKLTNCTGTSYSSAITDVSGNFSLSTLSVPTGNVCVITTPLSGYQAISSNNGTTGGTYSVSSDTLAFTLTANTNYTGMVFGEVPKSSFTPANNGSTNAGQTVVYAHTYVAATSASITFTSSISSTANGGSWSNALYLDSTCSGVLQSGDAIITQAISVTAGQTLCILDKVISQQGMANSTQSSITITATELYNPTPTSGTITSIYTQTDTTTIAQGGLTLSKVLRMVTVCPATASASNNNSTSYFTSLNAQPGQGVQYLITYTNMTASPMTAIEINDITPAYSLFESAFCQETPTIGISGCNPVSVPAVGSTGSIQWKLTDSSTLPIGLQPGGTGAVSFCVKIQQ